MLGVPPEAGVVHARSTSVLDAVAEIVGAVGTVPMVRESAGDGRETPPPLLSVMVMLCVPSGRGAEVVTVVVPVLAQVSVPIVVLATGLLL